MNYTRVIKRGSYGADVLYIKQKLLRLGCYEKSVTEVLSKAFGRQTEVAVRAYQSKHIDIHGRRLKVDGKIGALTWAAIERDASEPVIDDTLFPNISKPKLIRIKQDWTGVSPVRLSVVKEALSWATDCVAKGKYPLSLYIRGGNLYNSDLSVNTITAARIEKGAKAQPEFYKSASKKMMLAAVANNPATTGADCSGAVIGIWRKFKLIAANKDATANTLCGSTYSVGVAKDNLIPGDLVGYNGHVGIYVGGGFVVEWVGQNFGCALTEIDSRVGWDFAEGKLVRRSTKWTKFRAPKVY